MNVLLIFSNCKMFSAENQIPYVISGDIDFDEDESILLHYKIYNNSEKSICSYTIVFYVYDEDGNPPVYCSSNFVINITSVVAPYSYIEDDVNLQSYFVETFDSTYNIDYLYVSNILYSDGTVFSDPLGLSVYQ